MNQEEVLERTDKWVEALFEGDASGHDYWHMKRVVRLAKEIAYKEGGDIFICQMAAYLHDVMDEKLHDDIVFMKKKIITFLEELNLSFDMIEKIFSAMEEVSFKGNHQTPKTLEGKIVQDADRLDAIGAIGIARTFTYGGKMGNIMHDPSIQPTFTFDTYRNRKKTIIYHFYEKLLHLKDLMNTDTAKRMAEKRHQFMEVFLEQFYKEWNGTD